MRLLALLLVGCSAFEPPDVPQQTAERCGAVPVAERTLATAGHCVTYGRQVAQIPGADLQLVRGKLQKPIAKLALLPAELGSEAEFRGEKLVIVDPLRVSEDGRFFVLATPQINEWDCGFGLWQNGKLLGVAIGNDGGHSVFASSGEIARALKEHPSP